MGAGAGIMRSDLPDLGNPSATDHDVECRATAILLRGWRLPGDGDDASRDDVGHIMAPRLPVMAMLVVGRFFTTRSGGDGDQPIILIYCNFSELDKWPGVFANDLALC